MADFSSYNTGPSAEWQAFKAASPKQPPIPAASEDISKLLAWQAAQNSAATTMGQPKMVALAPQLRIKDHAIPTRPGSSHTISARSYLPLSMVDKDTKPACYIYMHGGGFFYGTLATEDPKCASLALAANVLVLSVDYRKSPVHTFPAAWEDAEDAIGWVMDGPGANVLGIDRDKVIVGGVSAGAWMTASTILGRKLQGKRSVAGQVLMVPALLRHLDCYEHVLEKLKDRNASSMKVNADVEDFGLEGIEWFTELIKFPELSEETLKDTRSNVGLATMEDVKGLPPAFVGVAGMDPLRDEGLLYAKRLAEAGVPTDVHIFPGVPHIFGLFADYLSEGRRSEKLVAEALSWMLSEPVPNNEFVIKSE